VGDSQWAIGQKEEKSVSKIPKDYGKYHKLLLEAGLIVRTIGSNQRDSHTPLDRLVERLAGYGGPEKT
jgi:hypothetical protein